MKNGLIHNHHIILSTTQDSIFWYLKCVIQGRIASILIYNDDTFTFKITLQLKTVSTIYICMYENYNFL